MKKELLISIYEENLLLSKETLLGILNNHTLIYTNKTDSFLIDLHNYTFSKENLESILKIQKEKATLTLKELNKTFEIILHKFIIKNNNNKISIEYFLESQEKPLRIEIEMSDSMHKIEALELKIQKAIKEIGYEPTNVTLTPSNRPDLGDYQYNGAMPMAKIYHEPPINIAQKIATKIKLFPELTAVDVASPGFINLTLSDEFLIDFANNSLKDITSNYHLGINKTIFLDYGGPNVAKVLHVGHLRSANIGQALNNLCQAVGAKTISDIHLGDWGRPMGMVIREIKTRYPDLPYFKEDYNGEEVDFNITNEDLIELYPTAAQKAKENENIMEEARLINRELQNKHKGYYALWQKIVKVSIEEIKRLYKDLNINFDLWEGESDNVAYMNELLAYLTKQKIITKSEGAQVIEVKEDNDKLQVPPLILIKSNNAVSYEATDLAAIWERVHKYNLDELWYVVDKRQELHFTQVFRAAYKSKIVAPSTKLIFNGFGTMNGSDGKPFKTRDGGVMPLADLLDNVTKVCEKRLIDSITDNRTEIAKTVAVAAIKYADLLPFRTTDYNFDIEKFTDLNGKTGTYLLYSCVRMNSLLKKAFDSKCFFKEIKIISTPSERKVIIAMLDLKRIIKRSFDNCSLNEICEYLYKITNLYNNFYAENRILSENNEDKKASWLALTKLIFDNNKYLLNILGINIPEKM